MVSQCNLVLWLPLVFAFVLAVAADSGKVLKRQKRDWVIAPKKLTENMNYQNVEYIAKIRSDKEYNSTVTYSLSGIGADQDPKGRFRVDRASGYVTVHSILDREEFANYTLLGKARYSNGQNAEKDIVLVIIVVDENDCSPVFQANQMSSVNESSAAETFVMRVIATDADEKGPHSQIRYSIQDSSSSMFTIDSITGDVKVRKNTLDRETKDTYTLTIVGMDMNGHEGGKVSKSNVVVHILDINDNIPTLEKESYEGHVTENTINMEVLRVKAIDLDVMYSDNWLAVFSIESGNEAGYVSITTDSKTNEGVIMIQKPLDYEKLKVVNLVLSVSNKAQYNFGASSHVHTTQKKTYPIKINVVNQKEGPRFQPSTKVVNISEHSSTFSIHKVITTYTAIDSDTMKTATNVRYAKTVDVDSWLTIDEHTAEIKLTKIPDRESRFLINGTYFAKIICITKESPSKTVTGTIAIQVEDFNDHCPELTSTTQTMCQDDKVVYVTAVDQDMVPNSVPFDFRVISEKRQQWTIEQLNQTTAILRDQADLWPGNYKVTMEIMDQQGKFCEKAQVLDVRVCTCQKGTRACATNRETSTAKFGGLGILLFLLGFLLLLLLPLLLLFCLCGGAGDMGTFKHFPIDTKQHLIEYNTEAQGEDKAVPLLTIPRKVDYGQSVQDGMGGGHCGVGMEGAAGGGFSTTDIYRYTGCQQYGVGLDEHYRAGGGGSMMGQDHHHCSSQHDSSYRAGMYDGMALSDGFLHKYYAHKSDHAAQQSLQQDALQAFAYEGQESPAGSVGCCSLLDNDNDLEFLNDLGPKFKTLADICRGSTLASEDMGLSVPPAPRPRPVSPARPSTSTRTHTESVREKDRVNVNTLNTHNTLNTLSTHDTSSVVAGTSTVVQESLVHGGTQGIVIPSQTMLIQQPTMYYTAAPMYVVDPGSQMVLVTAGGQQAVGPVGPVGLGQGVLQAGGLHGSQQQGVVLVERQVGVGGHPGYVTTNRAGQGSQQMVVETTEQVIMTPGVSQGGSAGGSRFGQQAMLVDNRSASAVAGGNSGFVQKVLLEGLADAGLEVRGQGLQSFSMSSQQGSSVGSYQGMALTATPIATEKQKVVQQQKISVTERHFETSSRA